MAQSTLYLAVIKASYDYDPQSEDEIAIKEDQILFLLDKVDNDWWKVKIKDDDAEAEGGLVPANFVEELEHKSMVKVLYDYEAAAPGELSIKEDEVLLAFDMEDDWLLVQRGKDGGAGFVPANYVEEVGEEEEEPSAQHSSAIVVPPSPVRPTAPYVDPAERVAQTPSRAQVDSVQTWAVSEVDKKGKKKKGTLGIGSGAIFFASESDKTPVQKWQTAAVESSRIEKSKHVHIEVGGVSPTSLHYNAGSKEVAEAILAKLDSSKRASSSSPTPMSPTPRAVTTPPPLSDSEPEEEPEAARESPKPKKNGVGVHFATSPPSIISPREPSEDGETEEYQYTNGHSKVVDDGQEWVTVLYDFAADGADELTVHEGDRLVVLERDSDEWWKVRNTEGHEGVVPASYVELDVVDQSGTGSRATTNATSKEDEDDSEHEREAAEQAKRDEEERERGRREAEARQREDRERKQRAEAERKAKAKAEAAEAERKRKEREHEKEEEEARRRLHEEQESRKRAARESRLTSSSGSKSKDNRKSTASPARDSSSKSRTSSDGRTRGPSPSRTRTWHDRTGQFKVDAEFLGFSNGKLRLHKVNGVVIEVPAEKMSGEDIRYIESVTGKKDKGKTQERERTRTPLSPMSDDDVPLAERRKSLHQESRSSPRPTPPKKGPAIDWFEFFLNAGCEPDDCTRYAHSFERDKMDESILPDITEQTMRTLGLREGDIIRVNKAIAQRVASGGSKSAVEEQLKRDEELARQIQEEENGGRSTPKRQATAPNLFSGPGGALKNNTRRGRPQPTRSTPSAVDLQSLSTASEQINRTSSPAINFTTSPTTVSSPLRASSAAPTVGGFDDDAWTNRPRSTNPPAPTPSAQTIRAPSAPPTQTVPAAPAPQAAAPPPAPPAPPAPSAPAQAETSTGNGLAKTTESDIFEQLARLSALRNQTATASPAPAPVPVSAPVSAVSPPPVSFQNGLGMGPSPVPLGQLQSQVTGFPGAVGPRGPLAPVPVNQGLLQPLVPTTTGFNSFVPTRPTSNPPQFSQPSPQPSFLPTQPTGFPGLQPQPTGFMAPQQTGFPGAFNAQQTGFPTSGPLMAQTTSYPGALGSGPFAGGRAYGSLQPNVTGFNPGYGQFSSPPPVPPLPTLPSSPAKDTSPANVFAAMKSGNFGDDSAPQTSNKYDALRPQPTGWGVQGAATGYQNGYSGPFY